MKGLLRYAGLEAFGGQGCARVLIAAICLVACGGNSPTAPTQTTGSVTPAPPTSTGQVIWEHNGPAFPRTGIATVMSVVVQNFPAGPLTVTLAWTPEATDLRIQVTNSECPGGLFNGVFQNDQCIIYGEANARASGSQRIDFVNARTRGLAFWISNYSSNAADYRLRVSVPTPAPAPTPTPVATPSSTPGGVIGQVALLGASIPFGQSVPTVVLGTAGQAAPSLTFRISVRTEAAQTGLLVQVFVRTATLRCMGAGIARLDFAAGEEKVLNTANVSYQASDTPAPCRPLPYSTSSVEILLFNSTGQQLLSETFPGAYTFLPPS